MAMTRAEKVMRRVFRIKLYIVYCAFLTNKKDGAAEAIPSTLHPFWLCVLVLFSDRMDCELSYKVVVKTGYQITRPNT